MRYRYGVLALDLGGTQIRAAAIRPDGRVEGRVAAATPLDGGAEAIYGTSAELLTRVLAALPAHAPHIVGPIGISSMGPVDPWRGLVVDPPNVPVLRNAPLADEVQHRLGMRTFLERDTNVAALAEHWIGAARGCDNFLYVTVSTGVGGAVFREGGLMLGPDGTAGELGHVTLILEDGPLCGCGGRGHLEGISGGAGIARQAAQALEREGSAFLADRARRGPLTGKDVAEGELASDGVCRRIMEQARHAFAVACVGWVNEFNPERIVVGGTVAERQGERWLAPARNLVAQTALRVQGARVQIVPAALGEDVGLVGAWPLVMDRSQGGRSHNEWLARRPADPALGRRGRPGR